MPSERSEELFRYFRQIESIAYMLSNQIESGKKINESYVKSLINYVKGSIPHMEKMHNELEETRSEFTEMAKGPVTEDTQKMIDRLKDQRQESYIPERREYTDEEINEARRFTSLNNLLLKFS